jgi:hypothetical protein
VDPGRTRLLPGAGRHGRRPAAVDRARPGVDPRRFPSARAVPGAATHRCHPATPGRSRRRSAAPGWSPSTANTTRLSRTPARRA